MRTVQRPSCWRMRLRAGAVAFQLWAGWSTPVTSRTRTGLAGRLLAEPPPATRRAGASGGRWASRHSFQAEVVGYSPGTIGPGNLACRASGEQFAKERDAPADVRSEPEHSIESTPLQPVRLEELDAFLNVLGIAAAAERDLAGGDAGLLAASRRRQLGRHVLDVAMGQVLAESLEVLERIVARDEGVAGVEVEPEVRGVKCGRAAPGSRRWWCRGRGFRR